jgi:pimeloyl-ACP methyl ester carboxylesterase
MHWTRYSLQTATQSIFDHVKGTPVNYSPELVAHYDIIGLDPRGVGLSAPLKCNLSIWNQPVTLFPKTEADFNKLVVRNKAMSESCRQLTGPLFDQLDTVNVAKDLELVRQALNEGKLNLLGHSYGSQIGTTYAELYPENVGRFALDAILDHSISEQISLLLDSLGYETTIIKFFQWCDTTSNCVLKGKDIAGTFKKVVDNAFAQPIRDRSCPPLPTPCTNEVSAEEFLRTVLGNLYFLDRAPNRPGWADAAETIKLAAEGNVTSILAAHGEARTLREITGIAYACQEWRHQFNSLADLTLKTQMLGVVTPTTRGMSAFLLWQTACVGWNASFTNAPRRLDATRLAKAPKILLVNSLWDPASVIVMATEVSLQLPNSVLAIRNGVGHGSYQLFGETSKAIDTFLIKGTLPEHGKMYES